MPGPAPAAILLGMPELVIDRSEELGAENARLRAELTLARAEKARLRDQNRELRATLAARRERG